MAVFENCSVLLELKDLPFKEKRKLKSAVTDNGGNICFVVNKQCSLIVTSDVSNLSANRLRSIQKNQTPVVGVEYVYSCLERGVLLPVDEHKLDVTPPATVSPPIPFSTLRSCSPLSHQVSKEPPSRAVAKPSKSPARPVVSLSQRAESPERSSDVMGKFRIYTETDSDLPTYPDNFQVARYSIFEKKNSKTWCVLELQSFRGETSWQYRVVRYWKDNILAKIAAVKDMLVFLSTSEEALEVYKELRETLMATGLQLRSNIPPQAQHPGSAALQQLLLEEKLNTGSLSQEVGVFVELLWTEALGCLSNILRVSVDKLSLNDVSRVEGLLLQAQRKLKEANHTEVASLLDEVNTLLPLRVPLRPTAKLISQTLDLCQLIRDVLNVSEMTLRSPAPTCLGKYRALRCSIETVPRSSSEFRAVAALLQDSKVQIQQVLRVSRGVELQTFKSDLGNIKPLLHSSSPSNFVGVLSRGLLLPRVGVEQHGIERTDVGNLGSGIYFSDAISTSLKYSRPGVTDGSRLLLVCDVALGQCKDVQKRDPTLTQAPEGHHSVHGVRHTSKTPSEFEDDEFVVYSPDQVKLKYVVQFSIEGDQLKEFSPAIITSAEPCLPSSDQELASEDSGFESIKNPLEDVTAGLLDSSGQQLPLQAVHVKCKLMDLLSQVIIFQKYTNQSSVPIEAKYVFPLDDCAAVCGFEAFINGKHVVGQVKEKETARKEYKQAIEKGHGAYLMDQDAPDVFTISVGNLPPGATVLIKVTFVSELIVRDGSILFSLPGSVAPWQESAALNQTTQVTVEKVCVTDETASTREFTLDMSIEMPYEISNLKCITHKVKIKRTDCKAVVSVLPGEVMGPEGFQLSVALSEVHLPRMWVEKHPDKDSQACMLVFYPDFDVNSSSASDEVVLLLDTSESMKGESLRMAQKIALQVLKTLNHNVRLNVILFGTDHKESFLTPQPLVESRQAAESFIKRFSPVGGSTELWRPLRALSLLPPSRGIRNLLLLSDGHIQNAELTLKLLRDNTQHSRLFTCGVSSTANRHMLRALAQAGGGAFEFFDTKTKHNWVEKVACQVKRMASPGCSSVSVKWQQFNPTAPPPVQAPKQLHALFSDCHTLVYGFVPHCTQATLLGNLSGQELKTMVSTSELQKTRGTFLHKLTARALIRDYEDGSLDANEAEHEGKKAELKHFIVELSKEFSILSQFTSFVAIEERDSEQTEGFTDIPKLIAEEDVDFLPYVSWTSPQHSEEILDEMAGYDDLSMESEKGLFLSFCAGMKKSYALQESDHSLEMDEISRHYSPTADSSDLSMESEEGPSEDEDLCEEAEISHAISAHYSPTSPMYLVDSCPFENDMEPPPLRHLSSLPPPPPPPLLHHLSRPPPPPPPGHHLSPLPPPPLPPLHHLPPPPPPPPCHAPLALTSLFGAPAPFSSPLSPSIMVQTSKGIRPSGSAPALTSKLPQIERTSKLVEEHMDIDRTNANLQQESKTLRSASPEHFMAQTRSVKGRSSDLPLLMARQKSRGLDSITSSPRSTNVALDLSSRNQSDEEPRTGQSGLNFSFSKPKKKQGGYRFLKAQAESELETNGCEPILGQNKGWGVGNRPEAFSFSSTAFAPSAANELRDQSLQPQLNFGFSFGNVAPQSCFGEAQEKSECETDGGEPLYKKALGVGFGSAFSAPPAVDLAKDLAQSGWSSSLDKAPSVSAGAAFTFQRPRISLSSGFMEGFRCFSTREDRLGTLEPPTPSADISPSSVAAPSRTLSRRMMSSDEPAPIRPRLRSAAPEVLGLRWTKIFQMQHSEGYWELTTELGESINVDVDLFANVFLKSKGIHSLGVRAHADILRLVATLLVLQLMRVEKLEEGKLLRTLFCLDDASQPRPERWEEVKRAVDWVCWADRQYPCVYSRLEFGLSWESSTRQLLGYEGLPPFSSLSGLNLQRTAVPLLAL